MAVSKAEPVKPATALPKLPLIAPEISAVVASPWDTVAAWANSVMVVAAAAAALLAAVTWAICPTFCTVMVEPVAVPAA